MSESAKKIASSTEFFGFPVGNFLYWISIIFVVIGLFVANAHHEQTARYGSDWSIASWLIVLYWACASAGCILAGYIVNTLNKILWSVSSEKDRNIFFD